MNSYFEAVGSIKILLCFPLFCEEGEQKVNKTPNTSHLLNLNCKKAFKSIQFACKNNLKKFVFCRASFFGCFSKKSKKKNKWKVKMSAGCWGHKKNDADVRMRRFLDLAFLFTSSINYPIWKFVRSSCTQSYKYNQLAFNIFG